MSEPMNKPMRDIPIESADQSLVELIEEVEEGEGFMITRDGFPIARLVRCGPRLRRGSPEWEMARKRMAVRLKKGVPLGGLKIDRDDLYDR